jgi:hypothetical protein
MLSSDPFHSMSSNKSKNKNIKITSIHLFAHVWIRTATEGCWWEEPANFLAED